ncbi:MAG: putative DNA-binding domain-containing protein, partial [Lysobacteraceae bacterium]
MTSAMPPESNDTLAAQQDAFAAHIRDPERVPPPPGIEERRLKIYRELFFNNVESMLAGNFPVLRRLYGDDGWQALIRAFYRDHDCQTPLFTELAREFLRYLDARASTDASRDTGHDDPPWLRELAHYEWIELALQISEARNDEIAHEPHGDLLEGRPLVSPLAWPLAYAWPVHRIGPDYRPET